MEGIWGVALIVGPILLLAAMIYAWTRNRNAKPGSVGRAERGARELQHEIEERPKKPVDL